jgi:chromosome segregation ATPase
MDQENEETPGGSGTLAMFETARSAANQPGRATTDEKKDEEKMSLFWRVFGGTILSIAALVVITLFNNTTSTINDLRNDIAREREARAALVKKEDVDTRMKSQYDRIRTVEGYKADIEAVKERVASTGAAVDAARKDLGASIDLLKKDNAGLDLLKERMTAVEGLKKDVAGIDGLKEKLSGLTSDLKTARDEVMKLGEELEKNKASDLERMTFRDSQAKQLDETLKELHQGLLTCREKIARLEGAQPTRGSERPGPKPRNEPNGDQ